MNIRNVAIIGAGNVGGALAKQFAKARHKVFLGVRDIEGEKVKALVSDQITAHSIADAVKKAEVIVVAIPAAATVDFAKEVGDLSDKIVIDATNSVRTKPEGYNNGFEAISDLCNTKDIVKCFNTTGAENMANPNFSNEKADMFVAGDSEKAKEVATSLAKEIGFGEVWDVGGNDKIELLEKLAAVWISLAFGGKYGRGIAFKILKR
jgi:8-hydroxy-5-deazaflavin:NADPH oxidoreductase